MTKPQAVKKVSMPKFDQQVHDLTTRLCRQLACETADGFVALAACLSAAALIADEGEVPFHELVRGLVGAYDRVAGAPSAAPALLWLPREEPSAS